MHRFTLFADYDGEFFISRIESGVLDGTLTTLDGSRHVMQPLQFDPVFNPIMSKERKAWEATNGKRLR